MVQIYKLINIKKIINSNIPQTKYIMSRINDEGGLEALDPKYAWNTGPNYWNMGEFTIL